MVEREAGGILDPVGRIFREGTVAGLTDAQLLDRYATRRDAAAFEAIVARYGPMVLGVCRRRLRDGHAAEDAFQATFLVLVRRAASIRGLPTLGPWIHGVAWRVAERARADAARRRGREGAAAGEVERAVARPDLEPARRELAEVLDRELGRLPEKYRAPVILCHLEGLTHEEAARLLGCPTGTVGIRLMRARARLKQGLARRGTPATVAGLAIGEWEEARPVVPAGLIEGTARAASGASPFTVVAAELAGGVLRAMLRSKIRRALIGSASMGVVAALAGLALARFQAEPKPARVVTGKVVDDRDRPIAGAEVWLPFYFKAADNRTVHADAEGRFSLPVPDEITRGEQPQGEAVVWALAPGHGVAATAAYRAVAGADQAEIVVRLGPTTDTAFTVLAPDGRPVAGAKVEPYHLKAPSGNHHFPPEGMRPSIGGITDDRGRVRLPSLARKDVTKVAVEAPGFGRQLLRLDGLGDEPAERTVRLRPVGRVEGRIVADRPELARGVVLHLSTEEELRAGGWAAEGEARVVTDEAGRFAVPALASGMMRVEGSVDPALPVRLRLPDRLMVRPGDATRVEIPLEAAVKVRGVVRSRDTKGPLAGATISVGYGTFRQSDTVTTGPDGKFEAYVVPGDVRLHVIVTPKDHVQLGSPWDEPSRVSADAGAVDLPPIELVKQGPPIPGKLVDGRDRPIAGVQVIAVSGNRRYGFARTDAAGAFTFKGIPAGLDLKYEAWTEDEQAVPTEVVHPAPLLLRARLNREAIAEAGAGAAISARVVDRAGKPVAGAELVLVETVYGPDGQLSSGRQWGRFGSTDADGWCRKPHLLTKGKSYHLIVQPGATAVAGGEPVRADGRGPIAFPPIVADRLREVVGRVEDHRGRPIGGASVMNRGNASTPTDATTAADGSFRLGGLPAGAVLLFAEAPGFRFGGVHLATDDGPSRLVLDRTDEPPACAAAPPPTMSREEARALANDLVAPDVVRVLAGDDREAQARLLEVLSRIDPAAAWAKITAGDKSWDRDAAKLGVFRALRRRDPDVARAALALVKTPFYRLHGIEEVCDDLPADRLADRKRIIAQGLAEARQLDNPSLKVFFLRHFARRLVDLGDPEAARAIVDEALPLAAPLDAGLGRPASTQGLASTLGRLDPEAAEALIPAGGDERSRNDMIGAVAEGVAAIDPARAARLFGLYTHQSSEVFTVHACRRMAGVDFPRARRLAASIKSEGLRGYAFGLMADALATADPAAASGLLDDMHRAFADSAFRGQGGVWAAPAAAVMAASLLPVVERVRPDRLDEFTWRALALRWQPRTVSDLTMTIPDSSREQAFKQGSALALYLARYDRDLARAVLAPAVDDFLATPAGGDLSRTEWRLTLMALALVDPARAAAVASAAPDARESQGKGIRESALLTVAKALADDPADVVADARMRITDLEILLREDR